MKRLSRSFYLGCAAVTLSGGRGLPSYDELRSGDPQYGCELSAATNAFYVDRAACQRSSTYAKDIVEHCVKVQCLGDNRSYLQSVESAITGRSGAKASDPLGIATRLIDLAYGLLPSISLGSGAVEQHAGALGAHVADELVQSAIERDREHAQSLDINPARDIRTIQGAYGPIGDPNYNILDDIDRRAGQK